VDFFAIHTRGKIMDLLPAARVSVPTSVAQSDVAGAAQVYVLKKSMDMQATSVLSLLQALPGNLPLAASGSLGTRVNVLA
jgi:hypothetical protein